MTSDREKERRGGRAGDDEGAHDEGLVRHVADVRLRAALLRRQRERSAQRYNAEHAELAAEFSRLTGIAPGSIRSIREWQRQHGLVDDGKVGPKTIEAARTISSGLGAASGESAPATNEHRAGADEEKDTGVASGATGRSASAGADEEEEKDTGNGSSYEAGGPPAVDVSRVVLVDAFMMLAPLLKQSPLLAGKPRVADLLLAARPHLFCPDGTIKPELLAMPTVRAALAFVERGEPWESHADEATAAFGAMLEAVIPAKMMPNHDEKTRPAFNGADHTKEKALRYVQYTDDKGVSRHGWDAPTTAHVKPASGDVEGSAVYAVSQVEGGYDSVQTYDSGILSFGVMQWTVHRGSLPKFLEFLKTKAGRDGKEAFDDLFGSAGMDVKGESILFNGHEFRGPDQMEQLFRKDTETARRWTELFRRAGRDPRVEKAQFDYSKREMIRFEHSPIGKYFNFIRQKHAKYKPAYPGEMYGAPEDWISEDPRARALFFSAATNNPGWAYYGMIKSIDIWYSRHGTCREKWPTEWQREFGEILAQMLPTILKNWRKRLATTSAAFERSYAYSA